MEHRPVDFDQLTLEAALSALPLGGLRVFDCIGSTNDEALAWAAAGAADLSLVVADEQTAGRGRLGKSWLTARGRALAMSLILRRESLSLDEHGRLAGLGALAAADACLSVGLPANIKWPNDVLIDGRKVGGVLVEARWSGAQLEAAVIGIGLNVLKGSAPPPEIAGYPATSMEEYLGHPLDRTSVLRAVVSSLIARRARIHTDEFIQDWQRRLAFLGRHVRLLRDPLPAIHGKLAGLAHDGSLILHHEGRSIHVPMGELHLVPDSHGLT